ncbi:diaminopropionate ammonia-lyase [Flavimaribacter sediminis]|nr:diaminopropionate ammonia-lyase [Flavimaribacter sediminis]
MTRKRHDRGQRDYMFRVSAERPARLMERRPEYQPTPARDMRALADDLGIDRLWLKDESQRMELGSFKALGGGFAVAQMISDAASGEDPDSEAGRRAAATMTFITASAGNHGLSVATGARRFGAKAVIVLPSSAPEAFEERIRRTGAEVQRLKGTYEESVSFATEQADRHGWLLLADGSWKGYVDRPALVMEGYTVIAEECRAEFDHSNKWPSHVFLQAGVGGFAGAISAHIRSFWKQQPTIVVVEPDRAPCLLRSIENGTLTRADGPLSNMGRLDCKDASLIAFDTLETDADCFTTITDDEAEKASQQLAEAGIATTPSGAASFAALARFDAGPESRCLAFITEGPEAR